MKRLTTEEFIERATARYGNKYDYSQTEYVSSITPVTIICPKHGAFQQLPGNHLRNRGGCVLCNKIEGRRMDVRTFVDRAHEVHGDRYDYSRVEYVNNRTPVCIVCKTHGEFQQTPYKHLSGQGCPKCAKNFKDSTVSFIEKARGIHGDFYDYSKVEYVDQRTLVCIIDPVYGEFWQSPNAHLNGEGCPKRRSEKAQKTRAERNKMASGESKVYELLVEKFGKDDVMPEYWSEMYPFACDFYVKSLDLYIELNFSAQHGRHWFDPLSDADVATLVDFSRRAKESSWYLSVVKVWTQKDPVKRAIAIRNKLNYLVFWNSDLSDFRVWYDGFDLEHPVLKNV